MCKPKVATHNIFERHRFEDTKNKKEVVQHEFTHVSRSYGSSSARNQLHNFVSDKVPDPSCGIL